ncbi:glycosyltransferase family 4 protein [Pararobbsia silviterrae]|uniref:Glycosyltransferase family 1 protein n=1 Tax=Pararobbsia silviterrae TaxID=1792498 RepID=A0A494X3P5_9BURK|nr:glycosyltransferase family 4 protein [Pararobbsia silviterrae]RKP45318.1 glycosyltransferase family 1 protein [Pararobbsia silviterrae]
MRIAIVTHVFVRNDGQGRVNSEVARAALDAGYTLTLIGSRIDESLRTHPRVRWIEIPEGRLPGRLLRYQSFAWRAGRWLARHRHEFDLVHVNGFTAWTRADVNSVHFVHRGFLHCGFYPFRMGRSARDTYQVVFNTLNAWLERWAFRRSRVIVPVSHKVADEVVAHGIDPASVHVIHNGVDIDEFKPGPSERASFGLPGDDAADASARPILMLFAGDIQVSRKNLDTVLLALARLPAHVHLAIAARLENGNPYAARVAEAGLDARVHFLGLVNRMPALMRSVDLFVFPSRYEAMSLVMLEALSSGLPVITARTAGGAEVIDAACGVVLDDPNDVDGLTGAIARVVAEPARLRGMGHAARERALSLGWPSMCERYLALYRRLFASPAYQTPPGTTDAAHRNTGSIS